MTPPALRVHPDVAAALTAGRPVVALETTLVAHGLPRPVNLDVAREVEAIVRAEGAVPATIGVVAGAPTVGLSGDELELIATHDDVAKLSVRDLPLAAALGAHGATTVAGTAYLAAAAGIRLFATGGLGGVHRVFVPRRAPARHEGDTSGTPAGARLGHLAASARESWDESADLTTLGQTPIAVVSAGVKSILDVGATLERLESLNVAVAGYRTRRFPGFYLADSGHALEWSVESEVEAAAAIAAQRALGLRGALLIANPIPKSEQLDPALHDRALAEGLAEVERRGIRGKAVTPFLLAHFHATTGGESLRVNTAIIRNNACLAARIAVALAARD